MNFGETQADLYFDGLQEAFERIASHPQIGRVVEGTADIRRYVHRRHSIFYRSDAAGILILDLLGAGQDPERHLRQS